VSHLLQSFAAILDELRQRGVVRSRNNPIADYAEWLVAKQLGLQLTGNSNRGYDAISPQDTKYQIKGRRLSIPKSSRQLSVIRNLGGREFDYLIAVLFDHNFGVMEAYKIPHGVIEKHARYSQHVNGHLLRLKGDILTLPEVENITAVLSSEAAQHVGALELLEG
jgi:hypothetical protein